MPAGDDLIIGIATKVKTVIETAHNFSELMQNQTASDLSEYCGMTDVSAAALQNAADLIHESTHIMNRSVIGVRDILKCGKLIIHISTSVIIILVGNLFSLSLTNIISRFFSARLFQPDLYNICARW